MTVITRRKLLTSATAALALPALVRASAGSAHVVVIGGGFGGATSARALRRANPDIRVTLIEPATRFYTCPFSNLYLAGLRDWDSLGHGFDGLRRAGIDVIHDHADDIDTSARTVTLAGGTVIDWDRLILSPGIDMRWNALEGYDQQAAEIAPHAWKAGPQTRLLRQQMEAMPDGGSFVMVIPENPFRCPPGPYERASMVAHYFKTHKPRSKILLLDAKDAFSKQALFQQGWQALYGDMIEWVGLADDGQVLRVDAQARQVETTFGQIHKADVLNVIPPQQAGLIATRAGVVDQTGWVPVHADSFAAKLVDHVHVVGDATIASPMPKSGFCASAQGKVAAAAIAADLAGQDVPKAAFANTCYSLIGPDYGISVAGLYRSEGDAVVEVPDSGGVSPIDAGPDFRAAEARYGAGWYGAITADIWGA